MTTACKKKLIIIGGRGNGTVLASAVEDIIEDGGHWEILGFLNDSHEVEDTIDGFPNYPVLGLPEDAKKFQHRDCYFFFALMSAKTSFSRSERLRGLNVSIEKYATFVHPRAYVSKYATLGNGVVIMPFSYVGEYARISNHVYIHGQSYVFRNSQIRDYSYLAPKSSLGAESIMDTGAYLGTACTVLERVEIGAWSVIGAGSTVVKNVPARKIAIGSPAKVIKDLP